MKRIAIIALCLALLSGVPAVVAAHAAMDAHRFALAPANFPSDARVVAAHVEPNRRIGSDRILHFGRSFAKEGRLTGYFMEAVASHSQRPRFSISYLVSIFGTREAAANAFAQQRHYWDALVQASQDASLPGSGTGDGAAADAVYLFRAFNGWSLTERLFWRGPVLVEVFLELPNGHVSARHLHAFFAIGTILATICLNIEADTGSSAGTSGHQQSASLR